jgi:hypothetical protein
MRAALSERKQPSRSRAQSFFIVSGLAAQAH